MNLAHSQEPILISSGLWVAAFQKLQGTTTPGHCLTTGPADGNLAETGVPCTAVNVPYVPGVAKWKKQSLDHA